MSDSNWRKFSSSKTKNLNRFKKQKQYFKKRAKRIKEQNESYA